MHREAVAAHGQTATTDARAARFEDARRVPTDVAAIWLVTADCFAARSVVAVRRLVRNKAAARADVTAARIGAAGDARDRHTTCVPTFGAARWVDVADARTADFVFATTGFGVRLEATSNAGARPRVARHAQGARGLHARRRPTDFTADGVVLADDRAAGRVFAARGRVRRIAGTFARAIAESYADTLCDRHAFRAPAEAAAERVDRAHRRTAEFVGAAGVPVHHEWRTRRGAVVDAEVAAEDSVRGAGFVPCARAAGRIEDVADVRAALFVFAAGEVARNCARAGAWIAACDGALEAVRASVDDAEDVPLDFAARGIDDADVVAALAVEAAGSFMRVEATACIDRAALVAVDDGEISARLIPTAKRGLAARWVNQADLATARGLRATFAAVREVATTRGAVADAVDVRVWCERTLGERDLHAGEVPFHFAAERIEVADGIAAIRVVAARNLVDGAATCGLERRRGFAAGAARKVAVVGVGRQLRAERIPTRFAAERILFADRFTADRVITEWRWLRIAAAARARVAAATAEALGPIHAGFVPRFFTATRVDAADGVAALGIAAIWVFVNDQARTCGRLAAFVGEFDRLLDAAFIPTHRAAVLKANRNADSFANRAVVAGRRPVWFEARILHKSAVGAVLLRDRHTDVVPRDVAARWLGRANESAAHRVAATAGKEIGREAVVGRVAAGVLGRGARRRREQGPRGYGEQHQTAERSEWSRGRSHGRIESFGCARRAAVVRGSNRFRVGVETFEDSPNAALWKSDELRGTRVEAA